MFNHLNCLMLWILLSSSFSQVYCSGSGEWDILWYRLYTWTFGQHKDLHQAQHGGHSLCKWKHWNLSLESKWMILLSIYWKSAQKLLPPYCSSPSLTLVIQGQRRNMVKAQAPEPAFWVQILGRTVTWASYLTSLCLSSISCRMGEQAYLILISLLSCIT